MRVNQPACLDGLTEAPGQEWLGTGGRVQTGRPGHRVGLVPVSEHHGGLHDAGRGLPGVKIFQRYFDENISRYFGENISRYFGENISKIFD